MPDFSYCGDDVRYYPSLSLLVNPGDTVTLSEDPGDGRFRLKGSTRAASSRTPDSTPEVGA